MQDRIENPFARAIGADTTPAKRVALRAMTGFEEELVERHGDRNVARLLDELVARCSIAPGAVADAELERVRAMRTVDRDLALIEIRRLSFGDPISTQVICPACGATNDVHFSLAELPRSAPESPSEVTVELEGVRALLRLPNCGDQEEILSLPPGTKAERTTSLLARVLVSYGDRRGPFDYPFVHGLPVAARRAMEEAIDRAIPELDLTMEVTCVECSAAFSSAFDPAGFFLPR